MTTHRFTLFADYHQFYIQDEDSSGDLSASWTPEATARLLALAPGVVGVGTARNVEVPVEIILEQSEPPLDEARWDHVIECDLAVPTGRLVVAGCMDYFPDAVRLPVRPGDHRVRVCMSGLGSISEDGPDGTDEYHLFLWPAPPAGVRMIKQSVPPDTQRES
jgi:hypothetical protein